MIIFDRYYTAISPISCLERTLSHEIGHRVSFQFLQGINKTRTEIDGTFQIGTEVYNPTSKNDTDEVKPTELIGKDLMQLQLSRYIEEIFAESFARVLNGEKKAHKKILNFARGYLNNRLGEENDFIVVLGQALIEGIYINGVNNGLRQMTIDYPLIRYDSLKLFQKFFS